MGDSATTDPKSGTAVPRESFAREERRQKRTVNGIYNIAAASTRRSRVSAVRRRNAEGGQTLNTQPMAKAFRYGRPVHTAPFDPNRQRRPRRRGVGAALVSSPLLGLAPHVATSTEAEWRVRMARPGIGAEFVRRIVRIPPNPRAWLPRIEAAATA